MMATLSQYLPGFSRPPFAPNPGIPRSLYHYLFDNTGSYSQLIDLFRPRDCFYETDRSYLGDPGEYEQIERLDWQGIRQIRRENFQYLMNWVSSISEVTPIFPELQEDNMPFGLPVYFSGVSRDQVNEELGNAGIGLTIHWNDIPADPRTNQNALAVDMAGRMLTLVIDQRIRHKQMDYMALNLIGGIAKAK